MKIEEFFEKHFMKLWLAGISLGVVVIILTIWLIISAIRWLQ